MVTTTPAERSELRVTILKEIARLSKANGRPPGARSFSAETGISQNRWYGVYWSKWSDALAEAGYAANSWQGRFNSDAVLAAVAEACLRQGSILTTPEMKMLRKIDPTFPNPKTVAAHFGNRAGLIEALRELCGRDEAFKLLSAALPEPAKVKSVGNGATEGWVYLLKSGLHFKIGRSDQIERRVKEISIALPETTALVHAIRTDDPVGIEAYWHRRFAAQRANGEWFKLKPADVAAFRRRKFQ